MKSIIASARIQNDDNVAAPNIKCALELYYLKANRWGRIGIAATDAKGDWKVSINRSIPNANYAPMLRLVEYGAKPAPKVLAQHAHLKYDAAKLALTVNFGVIERLQDDAYKLVPSNALFQRANYYVAAQAQQPVQVKLDRANRLSLAASTIRTESIQIDDAITKPTIGTTTLTSDTINTTTSDSTTKATSDTTNTTTSGTTTVIREATRLNVLATNIGSEVDTANKALLSQNLPYQFGRIDLSLKGAVGGDGQSITLAKLEDSTKDAAVSDVKMELIPTRDQAITQDSVTVPDVTQLTEGVVRRLLNSVGLRLESVNQSLGGKSQVPVGQSIRQAPKAGATLARNASVLVVFAAV